MIKHEPNPATGITPEIVSTNDTDLAQAAVYHTSQRGLQGIVADWGKRNPQAAAALQEYSSSEVSPSKRDVFKQRLFQPCPVKPQEVRRNSYDILEALVT